MTLVKGGGRLDQFRAVFGDEREDYGEALAPRAEGPPADWATQYVSAYASVHPFEDWAETWAHYLHLVDATDTAQAEGLETGAAQRSRWFGRKPAPIDCYREPRFEALMNRWAPLTVALNNVSRSMGHPDFYPFVIPAAAMKKLAFIHGLVGARAARKAA